MAETPRKDHWSSLLESIGLATATPHKSASDSASELAAEVPSPPPAEVAQQPEPAAAAPATPASAVPAAEPPKLAAKKPAKTSGHWGKLAGMLGLSVAQPEPEPEPAPPPPPAPPEPVFSRPAPPAESKPFETRPTSPNDLPPDLFAPPARGEGAAPRERDERGRGDRDRGERGRSPEPRAEQRPEGRREGRDSERGPERGERGGRDRHRGRDDRRDEERRPPRRDSAPRRGFGEGVAEGAHEAPSGRHFEEEFIPTREELGDEPAAPEERLGFDRPEDEGGEHPRRRRRGGRRRGRRDEEETREPLAPRPAAGHDEPIEAYADEVPFEDDEFAPLPPIDEDLAEEEDRPARRAPGDSEGGEDRGPRRRRRRRRGGRRDEAGDVPRSVPAPRSADRDDSDLEEEDDFVAERPAPTAARGRPQREPRRVPDEDDEVDEMLQAELDEEGGEGHAHKKIPTWQDTVGVLIDGNMSMRSERPEHRGGGRGRRPPRGR